MERLTIRNSDGTVSQPMGLKWAEALERLAYYEDLEEQGRLVVLPCKVGDRVYIPLFEKGVVPVRVQGISISVSGRTILRFGVGSAWGDDCGKDWFLTREEAETALMDDLAERLPKGTE